MDPFSHVVIGRALIAAVDDDTHRFGRGIAAAAVLGALAPDVDGLLVSFGWDIYLRAHEIGTHTIGGALLLGGASGALVAVFRGARAFRPRLPPLIVSGIAGSLSHIALDLVCGARIRVAWPLVDTRFTLPLIAMADPWFAATCAAAFVTAIAAKRRTRPIARGLLALIMALLCIKGAMLERALHSAPARFTSFSALEARFGSLTEWYGYERAPAALRAWLLNGRTHSSMVTLSQPIASETPLVAASRSLDTVRNFTNTHEFGFPRERADAGATTVLWSDLRYCWPKNESNELSGCALWFGGVFGPGGRVITQQVRVGGWVQTRPFSPSDGTAR